MREPADATARAPDLAEHLARHPPLSGRWVIHDLGGGSGAMGRWLAPRLSGPQHWIVHDRDEALLARAVADPPGPAADGARPGLLVPPEDPAALAAALRAWLGDSALRARLQRAARERRESLRPWPATVATVEGILSEVAR